MFAGERALTSQYLPHSQYDLSKRAAERWSLLQGVAELRRQRRRQRRTRRQARQPAAVVPTIRAATGRRTSITELALHRRPAAEAAATADRHGHQHNPHKFISTHDPNGKEVVMDKIKNSTNGGSTTEEKYDGFTDEERLAMKERGTELKAAARRGRLGRKADEEGNVLAKIAKMAEHDRVIAERLHAVITATTPSLTPRMWYGMPAYAKDGKIVCFFQPAAKFKARYATVGFNDSATLDDGTMWPTAFAVTELTAADEARIGQLVKKAVSSKVGDAPGTAHRVAPEPMVGD